MGLGAWGVGLRVWGLGLGQNRGAAETRQGATKDDACQILPTHTTGIFSWQVGLGARG